MLVTIAADLQVSLAELSATASLYFLLYGLMQPVWGMLSDRLGRVRMMRLEVLGVLVPGLLSALTPNLMVLVAARVITNGLFAAVIPASLVYIGDMVPMRRAARPWETSSAGPQRRRRSRPWRRGLRPTSDSGDSPSPCRSWSRAFWASSSPRASPNRRGRAEKPGR